MKYVALKTFSGTEGQVRRGQVLNPADHPTLTPTRLESLVRNRLIAREGAKEAKGLREGRGRGARDPIGVSSPNAGGLQALGWDPVATHENRVLAIGEKPEDSVGNEQGPHPADVPDGISTSPIASSSFSAPAPRPQRVTSKPSNGERPKRGTRRSS